MNGLMDDQCDLNQLDSIVVEVGDPMHEQQLEMRVEEQYRVKQRCHKLENQDIMRGLHQLDSGRVVHVEVQELNGQQRRQRRR